MKHLPLMILFLVSLGYQSSAQEIGVRFGDIVTNVFAIDGTVPFGRGRLHADISFGKNGVGLEILYDPLYKPLIRDEELYWYLGFGPYARFGDPFIFGAAGEAGLEYRIQGIPLTIGADWRPSLNFFNNFGFFADRFGVNARWRFGE